METTSFGFAASLLFVGVPTIFLIGLFVSTSDGEKSSFYSDTSKGRLSPEPKKWFKTFSNKRSQVFARDQYFCWGFTVKVLLWKFLYQIQLQR